MPAPVYIDFVARGMNDVSRAFRTVSDVIAREEARGARAVSTSGRSREREYQRVAKEAERWARQEVRDRDKAAKDKARITEREAREKVAAMRRVDAEIRRAQEKAVREFERDEEKKTAAAKRWVERRERDELLMARRRRERLASALVGGAGNAIRGAAMGTYGAAQRVAGTVLGLGGGFSVADAVQRSTSLTGAAADLANSALNPTSENAANRKRRSTSEIVGTARGVAVKYGLEASDAMKGLQNFTAVTGDLDTGMKTLEQMAAISRATGSELSDVAAAAGNIAAVLPDTADKGERVTAVLRMLAAQGKLGAIEMSDQAVQIGKVVAAAGKFEGDNMDNIIKLGALMQAARGGGGAWNAASASTAITAFSATFGKGARLNAFEAEHIRTTGANGKTRDINELLVESIVTTGGDTKRLNALFGGVMADRAIAKFTNLYKEAEGKQGGKGTGRAAIEAEITRLNKGATMTKEEVSTTAINRAAESDAKMVSMREKFDQAVEERLIPEFLKLVPVIEQLIPVFIDMHARALPVFVDLIETFAKFVEKNKWLIDTLAAHPIGAIMAAEVTKSIGGAALGELFKRLLVSAMKPTGGATGAMSGGALGGVGKTGSALAVVGSGIAAGWATKEWIDEGFGAEKAKTDTMIERRNAAINASVEASRGGMSDAQRASALELANKLRGDLATQRNDMENPSLVKTVTAAVGNIVAPGATAEATQTEQAEQMRAYEQTKQALDRLVTALEQNTTATKQNNGPNVANNPARDTSIANRKN